MKSNPSMSNSLASAKKKTRRRRHRPDERREGGGLHPAGLAGLQQNFGNRAVQRLLAQRQTAAPYIPRDTVVDVDTLPVQIERNLSGPGWVDLFPVSDKLVDLESSFGESVTRFVNALEQAGARVEILSTAWPPERAYLMHYAWQIANEEIDPRLVPPIKEVDFDTDVSVDLDIGWWHGNLEDSQKAAEDMLKAFGIDELEKAPLLPSRHVAREAIDMKISWGGRGLAVQDPLGGELEITDPPFDETNPTLIALGAAYGVIHYGEPDEDPVHWSVDGM
jgi:hypothetical protein